QKKTDAVRSMGYFSNKLGKSMMNSTPDAPDATDLSKVLHSEISEGERGEPKWSGAFLEFTQKLSSLPTPEEKIAFGLTFMRGSISQEGSPRFREFWESRRLILP